MKRRRHSQPPREFTGGATRHADNTVFVYSKTGGHQIKKKTFKRR